MAETWPSRHKLWLQLLSEVTLGFGSRRDGSPGSVSGSFTQGELVTAVSSVLAPELLLKIVNGLQLKTIVFKNRIRLKDFFIDFDKVSLLA